MNTFYARREVNVNGRVIRWVQVARTPTRDRWSEGLADGMELCLEGFRQAYGFTPRKGKTYRITMREFDVEEVTE